MMVVPCQMVGETLAAICWHLKRPRAWPTQTNSIRPCPAGRRSSAASVPWRESRPVTSTVAPCAVSRRAVQRPIPDVAPVTSADLLLRSLVPVSAVRARENPMPSSVAVRRRGGRIDRAGRGRAPAGDKTRGGADPGSQGDRDEGGGQRRLLDHQEDDADGDGDAGQERDRQERASQVVPKLLRQGP